MTLCENVTNLWHRGIFNWVLVNSVQTKDDMNNETKKKNHTVKSIIYECGDDCNEEVIAMRYAKRFRFLIFL